MTAREQYWQELRRRAAQVRARGYLTEGPVVIFAAAADHSLDDVAPFSLPVPAVLFGR